MAYAYSGNDVLVLENIEPTVLNHDTGASDDSYSLTVATMSESVDNETALPDVIIQTPGCQLYTFVVSTVLIGCLCIFGVAGNTAAFVVFQKDKLKTSTSFLFQGIAVVDNLLLVTTFPLYCIKPFVDFTGLFDSYNQFAHPIILVYVLPLAFTAQTSTVWSTVLIGVNRYIAVCHPYQAARLCSVRQARLQLAVVLGFSVLYNLPKFAEARVELYVELDDTGSDGSENTTLPTLSSLQPVYTALGDNEIYQLVYGNAFYTIFMLALPLTTLTVLNVRLMRALKAIGRRRAELQRGSGRPNCRQQQAQDNNVTLVLIIVVLVFTMCQAPALVTQFLWTVLPDSQRYCGGVQFYYSQLANLLVITNSSVNFIIYLTFNTRFRQILSQTYICGAVVGGPVSTEVSCTVGGPRTAVRVDGCRELLPARGRGSLTVDGTVTLPLTASTTPVHQKSDGSQQMLTAQRQRPHPVQRSPPAYADCVAKTTTKGAVKCSLLAEISDDKTSAD